MGSTIQVLHVEDDELDAELMQEMILSERNAPRELKINRVPSLQSALREVEQNPYNIVLLDLNLLDVMGIDNA